MEHFLLVIAAKFQYTVYSLFHLSVLPFANSLYLPNGYITLLYALPCSKYTCFASQNILSLWILCVVSLTQTKKKGLNLKKKLVEDVSIVICKIFFLKIQYVHIFMHKNIWENNINSVI